MAITIRKPFSRQRVSISTKGETITQQHFKKECDINNILAKYQKTGLVSHVSKYRGVYSDLSEPVDYQTALNVVIAAQESFDSLPSSLRKRFNNNPQEFLVFVDDPVNVDEMRSLGLLNIPADTVPASPVPDQQATPEA